MNEIEKKYKYSLKLAKGAVINFIGTIGGRGSLFLYTIFLARVLKTYELELYFVIAYETTALGVSCLTFDNIG